MRVNKKGSVMNAFSGLASSTATSASSTNSGSFNTDVVPEGPVNLGTATNKWERGYFKELYIDEATLHVGDEYKLAVSTEGGVKRIKVIHNTTSKEVELMNENGHPEVVHNHSSIVTGSLQTDPAASGRVTATGEIHKYTAGGSLVAGQPVAFGVVSSGHITVNSVTASTAAWQIVGICLNTCSAGEEVDVCRHGFTTVRYSFDLQQPSNTEIRLDANTNDTYKSAYNGDFSGPFYFRDSGGLPNNYGNNENYTITFDAGVGKYWSVLFNSF